MTDPSAAPVPFLDLKAQQARIAPELRRRIDAVLAHCQFILGPEVAELEARLAAFCGARHCVGVSSGTDAIQIALMAEGISRGDAVFLPAFTYTATAEVPLVLGATPVFVDVDPRTFQIDPAHLEQRIEAVRRAGRLRPRALIGVDLFGQPADWPALNAVAAREGLFTLDDLAQSFGCTLHARPLGAAAQATAIEVLVGFVFASITGIAVALVIVRFERFGRALYPLIVLFQNVPKVALAPIFILWFGFDLAPKILLIVVIAFFPVAIDMLAGLQSVEPSFVALMKSVGASQGKILMRVRIPHSLPHLMAGLKVAITFSVIGAIVGEFAGASQGLGYVIQFASTQLNTPLIFAALVVVSVLGLAFYYIVELAERLLVPWAPKYESRQRAA